MTSLILSMLVMTSSGGLLAERVPPAGLLVGAVNLNDTAASLQNMSLTELTMERARLLETTPSLGLGIALTAIGAGVLVTGLVIVYAAFTLTVVAVGVVVMLASVPLLIIGPILIAKAARGRRDVTTQVRLIDQRIAAMKRDDGLGAPPPNNEVPPPPPVRPPPGVELSPAVPPQLLLATF